MTDTQFDKLIGWLEIKFTAIDERFDRLEGRSDGLEARFDRLEARVGGLRTEMLERFQSVNDRLDALDRRVASLADGQALLRDNVLRATAELANVRQDLARMDVRLDNIERGVHEANTRVAALGEDMRQRFRVLTERVAGVEQKIAA